MSSEFQPAILPADLEALLDFDRRIFGNFPEDLFPPEMWFELETFWFVSNGERVGCSAFIHHADHDGSPRLGSLYIMTTGVLPELQGRGLGREQKALQIQYAREHGFNRIVTNTRKSNHRMIELNKKFGFRQIATVPGYYKDPAEPAIVMELLLSPA